MTLTARHCLHVLATAALLSGLAGGCHSRPSPATPTPQAPTTTPAPTSSPAPTPTLPSYPLDPAFVAPWLPDSAHLYRTTTADLDGDGQVEVIVLAAFGGSPDRLGYDWLQFFVVKPDGAPDDAIAWQSGQLLGDRAEPLEVRDINGDGRPEVVSRQAFGAAGETMFVLSWRAQAFDLLRPQGGEFGGGDCFGEAGAHLEDVDGDGLPEILASYGPMATQTDIYRWDGSDYVYVTTLQDK